MSSWATQRVQGQIGPHETLINKGVGGEKRMQERSETSNLVAQLQLLTLLGSWSWPLG